MEEKTKSNKESKEGPKQVKTKDGLKNKAFAYYNYEMEEKNQRLKSNNNSYYMLQSRKNVTQIRDMLFNLVYFYDNNFLGNKDFMHIPSFKDVLTNFKESPILMVTRKDKDLSENIIATATIKHNELSNPYFPCKDNNVFKITGILTKSDLVDENGNRIKGIGKEIFKSSIMGAYNLNKNQNIRLICELDCRNTNCLKAVTTAVKDIRENGYNISLSLDGYYEIINNDGNLTEAPTFVLEIELSPNKIQSDGKIKFDYSKCDVRNLNQELIQVIENQTTDINNFVNKEGNNYIIYHRINKINALDIELNVGNTANGNEREPVFAKLQYERTN